MSFIVEDLRRGYVCPPSEREKRIKAVESIFSVIYKERDSEK